MEVDYYSKYLKYKKKYTELKKQLGGAVIRGVKCRDKNVVTCGATPGCHWDFEIGKARKTGSCKKNECDVNDFGIIRGRIDCNATIGCTWYKDECIDKPKDVKPKK
jgi:hypothetical protein